MTRQQALPIGYAEDAAYSSSWMGQRIAGRAAVLVKALTLVAAMSLSLGVIACGGTSKSTPRVASTVSSSTTIAGRPARTAAAGAPTERYLNDGDSEKISDGDTDNLGSNHEDGDADSHDEYETTYDNGSYHDKDDSSVLAYGHRASPADRAAVTAVVKHYYTVAAAKDGVKACSMIAADLANSIPEEYGQASGPPYLRGAKTCPALMSLLFAHDHSHLTGAVEVTGVRVRRDEALALVGSTTMPAGDVALKREHGSWKIDALIGGALP